ncbi:hypothetical protein H0H92_001375 [Tricholoma furcatifolium]|nr:hypothetical protein H0H92_001375 [Tricholoma furcatifolium]
MNLNNSATPSPGQLKRNRPAFAERSGPEPPLPPISSDLILQVFTHVSLRRRSNNPEDYGDNERLIRLGELVLDAAVTSVLFNKRPILTTQKMILEREAALSDANLDKWVTMYNLRQKLRCHPDIFSSLKDPKETRSLFCAYVGGVYAENGMETAREWINHLLVDQDRTITSGSQSPEVEHLPPIGPPSKKVKSEPPLSYPAGPIFFASQPPPSPPMIDKQRQLPPHMHLPPVMPPFPPQLALHPPSHVPPPPPPPPMTLPNPLAPAQPSLPFLPLFNQTAAQRRVMVEYPAEFSGPSHAGQWHVRCIVNGIQKGMGSGPSKQIAKEEAARQAYYTMGWT